MCYNTLWKEYETNLGIDDHLKWDEFAPDEKFTCRTCKYILHTVNGNYEDDFWCVAKKLHKYPKHQFDMPFESNIFFQWTEPDKPRCKLWRVNQNFVLGWLKDPVERERIMNEVAMSL